MPKHAVSNLFFDYLAQLRVAARDAGPARDIFLDEFEEFGADVRAAIGEEHFEHYVREAYQRVTAPERREGRMEAEQRLKNLEGQVRELRELLSGSLAAEAKLDSVAGEVKQLRDDVGAIKRNADPLPRQWLYPIILAIVLLFVAALVFYGWAQKPTVAITYNVGDIIGGLLVGIGAMLAGIAYARSRGEVK